MLESNEIPNSKRLKKVRVKCKDVKRYLKKSV